MDVKYIRNEFGGIHSVDNEDRDRRNDGKTEYEHLLEMAPSGRMYLPHGWSEITEAEAKKEAPQLFGKPDPSVRMNARERMDAAALAEYDK